MKAARYIKHFKDRMVARLLPRKSAASECVSLDVAVTALSLERWRSDALMQPARRVGVGRRERKRRMPSSTEQQRECAQSIARRVERYPK